MKGKMRKIAKYHLIFILILLYYKAYLVMVRNCATIAQLVEHLTCNEDVAGSIPAGGS